MKPNILPEVLEIEERIIANRRHLHKYPELGFDVQQTAQYVADKLSSYGLEVKTGIGKTGVVAELIGENSGKTIALRADMDALPIQETSAVSYKSQNDGMMHACGHDGHMAMLLGAAKVLSQQCEKLKGNVRFIFQPAEEGGGGARYMIDDGCLDGVSAIFGMHLWNYQKYGEIGIQSGATMAAADIFDIKIKGSGGHGAAPQGTADAIVIAAQLIMILQTIVSRNTNPLESTVLTIGKINGGHGFNVIADEVTLQGTTRAMDQSNQRMIKARMQEIIAGVAKANNATIALDYQDGYPLTINDDKMTEIFTLAAKNIVGQNVTKPYLTMGAEDFSFYLQKIPGSFIFIGSAPQGSKPMSVPHHCSHFDIDERALLIGASVFVQLTKDQLY